MTTWGPIGETVYNRTYSRTKPDGERETWPETVRRVVKGNLELVPPQHINKNEEEELVELIEDFAICPAGRHLWQSGVTAPARPHLFNCHRAPWSSTSLSEHFAFTFNMLMLGGGVGSSFSNSELAMVPPIAGTVDLAFTCQPLHPDISEFAHRLSPSPLAGGVVVQIEDSREGWVDALTSLLDLAQAGGGSITFDVSKIRHRGQPIIGFGGTASGPAPLVELLAEAANVINENNGKQLNTLAAMKLDHIVSGCVVAGGVRRSARMSIKHWKDDDIFDFITCKSDDPEAHWSTNISVSIDNEFEDKLRRGDTHATSVFEAITRGMLTNGEPGLFHDDNAHIGEVGNVSSTNPCGEICLEEYEPCNLGHLNLFAFAHDWPKALRAAHLMTRFLIRATFAPVEHEEQRKVLDRNRRIGLGLFGVQEFAAAHGVPWSTIPDHEPTTHRLQLLRTAVDTAAVQYAHELRIPVPIKRTTIAPTGSIAQLGGFTQGIHPTYARYFVRRIRFADTDPELEKHKAKGHHIEPCQYTTNTQVVSVPCRDTILDRVPEHLVEQADEISIFDMLAVQALFQKVWADNAVSFTANIGPETTEHELRKALLHFMGDLKGTTIFPDMSRPQAPYERITKEDYERTGQRETSQSFDDCATGACPVR